MISPTLLQMFYGQYSAFECNQSEWVKRILKEWEESKKLPRKAKKQKRKELNLDYGIATFDPFSML